MTFIVKSRWGYQTANTKEEALKEAAAINEQDKRWELPPSAIAFNANPIEADDVVPSSA